MKEKGAPLEDWRVVGEASCWDVQELGFFADPGCTQTLPGASHQLLRSGAYRICPDCGAYLCRDVASASTTRENNEQQKKA